MEEFLVISDLHNRPECDPRFDYMREHYPNHKLIVPGDIVQDGRAWQYSVVKAWLHRWDCYPCPGNHGVAYAGLFDFWAKLGNFDNAFGTGYSKKPWPKVDILGDVALIGLNSNPGTWGWWLDFARGKIGKKQLQYLRDELVAWNDKVRIVYLHHHPFVRSIRDKFFMGMKDKLALLEILSGNCEALIFGHMHKQEMFPEHSSYNIPLIYAAGAFYRETEALEIMVDDGVVSSKMVAII